MRVNRLLFAGLLVLYSISSHAVWICHRPDGTTWQQRHPPCDPEYGDNIKNLFPDTSGAGATLEEKPRATDLSSDFRRHLRNNIFSTEVRLLEIKYPIIDPKARGYDAQVRVKFERVVAAKIREGFEPKIALHTTAHDFLAPSTQYPGQSSRTPIISAETSAQFPATSAPDGVNTTRASSDMINAGIRGALGAAAIIAALYLISKLIGFALQLIGRALGLTKTIAASVAANGKVFTPEDIQRKADEIANSKGPDLYR